MLRPLALGFALLFFILTASFPLVAQTRITGVLLGTPPPGLEDVLDALNLRLRQELGVQLDLRYIGWNEMNSKYPLVLAAGDVDWIFTANWAPYTTQAVRGAFLGLSPELLKATMPRHWAATVPEAWEQAKVGGKIYMVPTATPDRKVPVALIRGDLRRRYGLPPLTDARDLEPYLAAVKKHETGLVPLNLGNGYDIGQPFFALLNRDVPPLTAPFFGTIYGNYEDPARGLVNLLEEPWRTAYRGVALTMKRWYDRGYLNRAPFANTTLSKTSFAQGRSAVGFGNSQDVQEVLAQAQSRGYEPEILPLLSSTGHSAADGYTGNGVALAASGKHPRLVLQTLDLIMEDPDIVRLVSFGVEGRHWVASGGRVALPHGVDPAQNPYPIEAAGFWFVNKDLLPPLARWSPAYESLRLRVPGWLVPNTFFGFSFVPQAVKNEVAAITTVMTQYGDVLAIGAVADVDKALVALETRLQAARQDKVLAELRAQLKAFSGLGAGALGSRE